MADFSASTCKNTEEIDAGKIGNSLAEPDPPTTSEGLVDNRSITHSAYYHTSV